MGLRKRIMLLVAIGLVVATAPLGVMGVGMLRAAKDRMLAERLVLTRATAEHLDWRLARSWQQLEALSGLAASFWRAGDLDGMRAGIRAVVPQLTLFTGGIFLMDSAGRLVLQEPASPALSPPPAAALPSVRKTLIEGRPGTSGLVRTAGGLPAVIFTVPVSNAAEVPAGALGGIINLADPTLQAFIDGMAIGASGHAAIVDEEGIVLASTDPAELFTREEHPEFFARLIRERRAQVGPTEEAVGRSGSRETHVMAFAPVAAAPWGLAVGQNEEETFGPIRRLRDRIVLFGVGVLMAALLFAWLDTGAVAAPLRLLKEGAERIAGGDLARRIEVRRADEVGALAGSFETMRVRLIQSLEEIRRRAHASESLYQVGTEVLSLRDRDVVLQSVAERAASLLHGDVAVLCLVNESGHTAGIMAVAGFGVEARGAMSPWSVPVHEEGPRCEDCAYVDAVYRKSHLAAPLMVGGRAVGALCVGRQSGQPFSGEDREVLDGLANLAAIAVENARLQERVHSMAVLEERERIAREMHDGVGQVLGYVNTKAQAVKVLLDAGKIGDAQAQLAQLEEAAREVYADLREAILGLRTEAAPERRLMPALQEYVRRFGELSGVVAELIVEGDPSRYTISPLIELHLIRIVQEALTNVRKHAMARRAWVKFSEQDGVVTVSVRDDGQGFDPSRQQGGAWPRFGMRTMRERAEAIGGTFVVRSESGSGAEVVVRIPVSGERAGDARAAGG
jgi:nitrate/nitrite-specific signal transduction histidine kinase